MFSTVHTFMFHYIHVTCNKTDMPGFRPCECPCELPLSQCQNTPLPQLIPWAYLAHRYGDTGSQCYRAPALDWESVNPVQQPQSYGNRAGEVNDREHSPNITELQFQRTNLGQTLLEHKSLLIKSVPMKQL